MSVRKRTLPSGETRWLLDYRDQNGHRRAKQFSTKAQAVACETRIRGELAAGTHTADGASVTVAEAGALWLQRAAAEKLEASTVRQYAQHLDLHIAPFIGTMKLSKLTRPAVEQFRDRLLETRSRPLARAVLASLKGIAAEAQRRGLVGQNAAAGCTVRISARGRAEVQILTKEQLRAILAKSPEMLPTAVAWRPLVGTAAFTGMRVSEMRGLTWAHVDFQKGIIQVRQRADFQNRMGSPKSAAGTRDIPLAPMVINVLKTWKLACPASPLGLVFPNPAGGIPTASTIHRAWVSLLSACGIPHLKFHSLRHFAASIFIEQGWSPKKLQTVLGHASIQMVFDRYGHLFATPEDDATAMAQIQARVLGA